MKKEKILFVLGIWVAVLGSLGFFTTVKKILFVLTGLGIMFLAHLFYQQAKRLQSREEKTAPSFLENNINHEKQD